MEIEDRHDAEDAIKDINGKSFNGTRIKVEFSHAYSGNDRRGGGRHDFDTDKRGRRVSDGKFRRTNYRLVVSNLSSSTSWQVNTITEHFQVTLYVQHIIIRFFILFFVYFIFILATAT